ncbi:MAG: Hsp70 family protein [Candidatus Competibacteraceae bacterium]
MAAIGIDLGTTNSVAAIYQNNEVRILRSLENEDFVPSVVSLRQDGALLVGRQAWNNAVTAPENTIFSIKRLMGHSFNDAEISRVKENYPYSIVNADDPNDSGVRVLLGGRKYTPEAISAMILRHVAESASQSLGEPVTHAVITVPAYFKEPQRKATYNAGVEAGLIVTRIIDEPTAAALAFGIENIAQAHQLLVFDMGGGTLDISIGYLVEQHFEGDRITGDMWLGGDDFDRKIAAMIEEWVKETYGVSIDPSGNKRFQMIARREAEKAKCRLSQYDQVSLFIPAIVPLPGGQTGDVGMTITRSEFEVKIRPYIERSIQLVEQAIKDKHLSKEDISAVLLVGGATFIPLVRKELETLFGKEKLRFDLNPMEAVARGAAILAAQSEGIQCLSCKTVNPYENDRCTNCGAPLTKVNVSQVTPHPLGIGAVRKGDPDVFSILIEADTHYPLEQPKRRRYMTTDRKITIPVYEGDNPKASGNQYLGSVEYNLPDDVPKNTPVWVEFNYDRNRMLDVHIEVEGRPELSHKATPKNLGPELGKLNEEQWRSLLQNSIVSLEDMLERYGEYIEEARKTLLTQSIDEARKALRGQDRETGQQALAELSKSFLGLGVATDLFLADRLLSQVDPKTAGWLAAQTKQLRDAHKANSDQVTAIKNSLELEITHIIKTMPVSQEMKGYRGLLEIIETKES